MVELDLFDLSFVLGSYFGCMVDLGNKKLVKIIWGFCNNRI